jgi:hypothetical protein
MAGEADMPYFPGFLGGHHGLEGAIRCEKAIWIFHADIFMVLNQINVISLKTPQGFIDLLGSRFPSAAIEFCHEKYLVAVSVPEG